MDNLKKMAEEICHILWIKGADMESASEDIDMVLSKLTKVQREAYGNSITLWKHKDILDEVQRETASIEYKRGYEDGLRQRKA